MSSISHGGRSLGIVAGVFVSLMTASAPLAAQGDGRPECWEFDGVAFPTLVRLAAVPRLDTIAGRTLLMVQEVPLLPDTAAFRLRMLGLDSIGRVIGPAGYWRRTGLASLTIHWKDAGEDWVLGMRRLGDQLEGRFIGPGPIGSENPRVTARRVMCPTPS